MPYSVFGRFALFLSITGATVRVIPQPPPYDVPIVGVSNGNMIVMTAYGDPFKLRLVYIYPPHTPSGAAALAAKAALGNLLEPGTWVSLQNGMAFIDRKGLNLCSQKRTREAELPANTRRDFLLGRTSAMLEPGLSTALKCAACGCSSPKAHGIEPGRHRREEPIADPQQQGLLNQDQAAIQAELSLLAEVGAEER